MSRQRKLQYDLSNFDQVEFDLADRLVRAVILSEGRQAYWREPRKITTNKDTLTRGNIDYIELYSEQLDAACFERPNGDFDIWFSPELDVSTIYFRSTLLHELCHGYLGTAKGHNHIWKQLFTRVLYHYNDLVEDLGDVTKMVHHTLADSKYSRRSKSETKGQFAERMLATQSGYIDRVLRERDRVLDTYNRICDKEYALA